MQTLGVTYEGSRPGELNGTIADGLESIRQRAIQRIHLWAGTWFLDTTRGTPYETQILGTARNIGAIRNAITNVVRDDPDITGTSGATATFDSETRHLSYEVTIHTIHGDTQITRGITG